MIVSLSYYTTAYLVCSVLTIRINWSHRTWVNLLRCHHHPSQPKDNHIFLAFEIKINFRVFDFPIPQLILILSRSVCKNGYFKSWKKAIEPLFTNNLQVLSSSCLYFFFLLYCPLFFFIFLYCYQFKILAFNPQPLNALVETGINFYFTILC